jgi:hypothetical protein
VFGFNLALNLSRHPEFAPCLLSPTALDQRLVNPLHYALLKPHIMQQQRLQRVLDTSNADRININLPIIHALGNNCGGGDSK